MRHTPAERGPACRPKSLSDHAENCGTAAKPLPTFGLQTRRDSRISVFSQGWQAGTRLGRAHFVTSDGSDDNDKGRYVHDDCGDQCAARGRDDERRAPRHFRLFARHRVRVVRLLHLRHARRVLAKHFFSGVTPNAGFIFALLAFAAGFAVRPFGALVFGRLGDMVGRKYTFLITMTLMGVGTFLIGVLPGYATGALWRRSC